MRLGKYSLRTLLSIIRYWRHLDQVQLDLVRSMLQLSSATEYDLLHLFELLIAVHRSGIPSVSLRTVVDEIAAGPRPFSVTMHPALTGIGSGSTAEMAALSVLVAARRPKSVLEFGTHEGCSTWHLWANTAEDTVILTIDLPSGITVAGSSAPGLHGVAARPFLPKDPRICLIEADSRQWMPPASLRVDFCFIDAGHTYECVKNDTEKAMAMMNPKGLIAWHDGAWIRDGYGVNLYLRELRAAGHRVRLISTGPYDYSALAVLSLP
jgi:Methyltransferase domain